MNAAWSRRIGHRHRDTVPISQTLRAARAYAVRCVQVACSGWWAACRPRSRRRRRKNIRLADAAERKFGEAGGRRKIILAAAAGKFSANPASSTQPWSLRFGILYLYVNISGVLVLFSKAKVTAKQGSGCSV